VCEVFELKVRYGDLVNINFKTSKPCVVQLPIIKELLWSRAETTCRCALTTFLYGRSYTALSVFYSDFQAPYFGRADGGGFENI
jgi:hypothetical protein